jgi:hypothetical protein
MTCAATVIIAAFVLSSSSGCAVRGVQEIDEIELALRADEILWVPDNAAIEADKIFRPVAVVYGRSVFIDGSAHVAFTMRGEREALTTQIVNHFALTEWRARDREYLNPQIFTSFNTGWRHVCGCIMITDADGRPVSREPYYDWHGEWDNQQGDVVQYALSADGPRLRGYASFIPKRLVELRRR